MKINTVTQLIVLIVFALTLNLLALTAMLIIMFAFIILFLVQKNSHFIRLMKRLKWLYLMMFLIYLLSTPGEHMVNWAVGVDPTFEGLRLGVEQVLRVVLMLAALSLLLVRNTVQALISGLYFLLKPLAKTGVDVERFAARLWLTLQYAEMQQAAPIKFKTEVMSLGERLNHAFMGDETQHLDVVLEKPLFTWFDYTAIALMLAVFVVAVTVRGV